MHDGNRGKGIAAVAGIVLLLLTFGIGLYVGALNYPKEERYQSYRYAADKPSEVDRSLTPPSNAETLEYRRPCQNPKGHDESDLCAQWKAANAAGDNAFWAKWGVWITGIGIVGLLITIAQGRLALERARDANEIARNSMVAETRAWVKGSVLPAVISIEPYSMKLDANIQVINVGNSPAIGVRSWGDLHVRLFGELPDLSRLKPIDPQFFKRSEGQNLWPGDDYTHDKDIWGEGPRKLGARTVLPIYEVILRLVIEYRTIFDTENDEPRRTTAYFAICKADDSPFVIDGTVITGNAQHYPTQCRPTLIGYGDIT